MSKKCIFLVDNCLKISSHKEYITYFERHAIRTKQYFSYRNIAQVTPIHTDDIKNLTHDEK